MKTFLTSTYPFENMLARTYNQALSGIIIHTKYGKKERSILHGDAHYVVNDKSLLFTKRNYK